MAAMMMNEIAEDDCGHGDGVPTAAAAAAAVIGIVVVAAVVVVVGWWRL